MHPVRPDDKRCLWSAQQMQEIEDSGTQISTTPEWKALEDHVTEIERT
jgi:hypothetical protein